MKKTYADVCLERAEKATEGPFIVIPKDDRCSRYMVSRIPGEKSVEMVEQGHPFFIGHCLSETSDEEARANAELFAHSRTDVPELARRLKKACEVIHDEFCSNECHPYHLELERMPEEK
jgi:hypothetical protein